MRIEQVHSLSEQELGMVLYIVNVLRPVSPSIEIPPVGLTWFKPGALEQKVADVFPQINPESHAIYSSLLNKMGVQHEIKYEQPPTQLSGSI